MATPRRLQYLYHLLPLLLVLLFSRPVRAERLESSGGSDDPCPARSSGPCPARSSGGTCPVNCFRPDPVCGVDGVTYWCGCPEAACARVCVAKQGYCQVGNGGSGLVCGQALLLLHIVWLIVLWFAVLFGYL